MESEERSLSRRASTPGLLASAGRGASLAGLPSLGGLPSLADAPPSTAAHPNRRRSSSEHHLPLSTTQVALNRRSSTPSPDRKEMHAHLPSLSAILENLSRKRHHRVHSKVGSVRVSTVDAQGLNGVFATSRSKTADHGNDDHGQHTEVVVIASSSPSDGERRPSSSTRPSSSRPPDSYPRRRAMTIPGAYPSASPPPPPQRLSSVFTQPAGRRWRRAWRAIKLRLSSFVRTRKRKRTEDVGSVVETLPPAEDEYDVTPPPPMPTMESTKSSRLKTRVTRRHSEPAVLSGTVPGGLASLFTSPHTAPAPEPTPPPPPIQSTSTSTLPTTLVASLDTAPTITDSPISEVFPPTPTPAIMVIETPTIPEEDDRISEHSSSIIDVVEDNSSTSSFASPPLPTPPPQTKRKVSQGGPSKFLSVTHSRWRGNRTLGHELGMRMFEESCPSIDQVIVLSSSPDAAWFDSSGEVEVEDRDSEYADEGSSSLIIHDDEGEGSGSPWREYLLDEVVGGAEMDLSDTEFESELEDVPPLRVGRSALPPP